MFDTLARTVESTGLEIKQRLTIWTKGRELVMNALMFEVQGVKGTSIVDGFKTLITGRRSYVPLINLRVHQGTQTEKFWENTDLKRKV